MAKDPNTSGRKSSRLWLSVLLWVTAAGVLMVFLVGEFLRLRGASVRDMELDDLNKGVQTVFFMLTFLGVVATGVVTYQRQRTNPDQHDLDSQRSLHERYAKAAEMIAHDSPSVRIAGLNVVAQLGREVRPADKWRQTCINLLCSYLRDAPKPPEGTSDGTASTGLGIRCCHRGSLPTPPHSP